MSVTRSGLLANDGLTLAAAYCMGATDPVAVLEKTLESARQAEHVFIFLDPERARREAEASWARWKAGQPLSVLDGVPIAWKDLFDVSGSVTTAGAAVRRGSPVATTDAYLVRQLARAGLVSVGKTNLSELAYSGLGLNPHFGTPANAASAQERRIPGGSSSGSGVAVGAGIVPIAMGTDTAGSIRIPAALNGVVGYRSTTARYPMDGVFPLARTLDALGPITRSVRDVLMLDALIKGATSNAPEALPVRGLRLRVDPDVLIDSRVEPAVRENLEQALKQLCNAGALVDYRPVQALQQTLKVIETEGWLGSAEAFTLHEALLGSPEADQLDPRVRTRLEAARHFPASRQIKLYQARERLQREMTLELDGAVLVTPTVAHVAPLLEPLERDDALFIATNLATLRLTMPGSLLDMPGVSLRSGCDGDGLPTGLLLSVPSGEDTYLLRVALGVEAVLLQR